MAYDERRRNLAALGYSDYETYLRSDLWASIRGRVLRERRACVKCGHLATQVHHSRYTLCALAGLETRHLWPVCRDCHQWGHKRGSRMVTLSETNRRLGLPKA